MRLLVAVAILCALYNDVICPPVNQKKAEPKDPQPGEPDNDDLGLEYERYLKEVVNVLEQDETFRKKLEQGNSSEIRSGEIAQHLEFVHHSVRTKLDELKRKEIERLKLLSKLKNHQMPPGIEIIDPEIAKHIDHGNHETFEVDDLEMLIKQTTDDLEKLDKQRRKDFKEYEMQKEHEHKEKLKNMNEKDREAEEKHWKEMKEKHKKHPKLHHPGSRDQLEEVWEESDHMDKDNFNPKTFFNLHDLNSDGELDANEVESMFERELAKVYDEDAEEDDLIEKEEERARMREHVFGEVDKDKDGLISLKEFLESADASEFNRDEGWKTLDEEPFYTDEELQEYEKQFLDQQGGHEAAWEQHGEGQQQPGVVQDHQGQGQGQVHQMDQGQFQQAGHAQGGQQFQQPPHPAQQQQQQGQPQQHIPQAGQQQQFQQPPHVQSQQQFQQPPHVQGQQQFQQPPQGQQQQEFLPGNLNQVP